MKIVAATKNKGKLSEIRQILGHEWNIISMSEAGADVEVIEDGRTFEENAVKKALEVMRVTGLPALADDSGLEVDYLNGAPGVYSARYAGEGATDADRINKLLGELKGVPLAARTARFVAVAAVAFPDGRVVTARGECEGYIGEEPAGSGGFGYDPVFVVSDYGRTFAQLDSQAKNAVSHRGRAFECLKNKLKFR